MNSGNSENSSRSGGSEFQIQCAGCTHTFIRSSESECDARVEAIKMNYRNANDSVDPEHGGHCYYYYISRGRRPEPQQRQQRVKPRGFGYSSFQSNSPHLLRNPIQTTPHPQPLPKRAIQNRRNPIPWWPQSISTRTTPSVIQTVSSGKGDDNDTENNNNGDGGNEEEKDTDDSDNGEEEEEEQEQQPPQLSLSLADRIQPWTGASDASCLNAIGVDGYALAFSFHCTYHTPNDIREYWFVNGRQVRIENEEMKQQMARKMIANGK